MVAGSFIAVSMTVCIGVILPIYGQTAYDVTFLPIVVSALAGLPALAASKWRVEKAVPLGAEAANLRTFLESPDAAAAGDPGRVGRFWRRAAVIAAVYAVGLPVVAWLSDRAFGFGFELAAARLLPFAVIIAVVGGMRFGLENVHRPRYWARRVSVAEDGVRFGRPWIGPWSEVVPWTDVLDVTLDGPSRLRPGEPSVTVWTLRDGTQVRVSRRGSRRPPEELILAARSHKVAAC